MSAGKTGLAIREHGFGPSQRIGSTMTFRMVWIGSEDDPDETRATDQFKRPAITPTSTAAYQIRKGEMVRREERNDGKVRLISIANFTARIVRDVLTDEEGEASRRFIIEAETGCQRLSVTVTAAEFCRKRWILEKLGPAAICYPGEQQHVRAAIQSLSGTVQREYVYTRPGWRKHQDGWIYVHGGVSLGAAGPCNDISVEFPSALQLYRLNPVAEATQIRKAVRASLRFLSVAPDRITWPLLAAVYRAPLGKVDFSLFLAGRSGVFKTALAALCQQYFGAEMEARSLPGHFGSTANALEEMACMARDCLVVVDDFVPVGEGDTGVQVTAERLFRAAGNRQGRGRITSDGRLRRPRPPQALLLATGEAVPKGMSLRARMLIVEVRSGEVNQPVLSEYQDAGSKGASRNKRLEFEPNSEPL